MYNKHKGNEENLLRDELKNISELENDPDAIICYQDEVHFMAESTVARAWDPKGNCPKVKTYTGHKSVAYSGFVIPETGELFIIKAGLVQL